MFVTHLGDSKTGQNLGPQFRAGNLGASEVDLVILQYSRAAKELWKFCKLAEVEVTARIIAEALPADWWEPGAPRRR